MGSHLPDGVFAAALTPLRKDLSINYEKAGRHCKSLIEGGCDGIVLMGTTGEANSFNTEERKSLLENVVSHDIGSDKILIGTGCCSLTETVELTRHALEFGVNHVLVLPPFYYPSVSDEGLYQYFDELIGRVNNPGIRIFLYNFPKMTGLPFSHELIERFMASFPDQVIGIKDSSGDWNNMSFLQQEFPGFRVFTGTEVYLRDLLSIGGSGTISASLNVMPHLAADLYKNANSKNAAFLQEKLTIVRRMIEKYPMIPVLKLIMSQIDGDDSWLFIRPPLTPLSLWNEDEINEIIEHVSVHP